MVINNQPQELRLVQREYFRNYDQWTLFNTLANRSRSNGDEKQAEQHSMKEQQYYNAYLKNIEDGAVVA